MTIEEFIQIFIESFDEPIDTIQNNTKYKELEDWTSMQALILIAHLDDSINVVLTADDIRNANTIEALYAVVKSKL